MSKEKPTIMVVEDESLLLQAITKKLDSAGISTISCTSGEQAISYLRDLYKAAELPDIIWLDYHLKDMDGITFMHKLKSDANIEKIPVFVVSNSASEDKVRGMLALGAKEYMLKAEMRLDEIIGSIKEYLGTSS